MSINLKLNVRGFFQIQDKAIKKAQSVFTFNRVADAMDIKNFTELTIERSISLKDMCALIGALTLFSAFVVKFFQTPTVKNQFLPTATCIENKDDSYFKRYGVNHAFK